MRLIHSVASDSVLRELGKHAPPGTEVLVEVNIAGEEGKSGIAPGELDEFIERCPVVVGGPDDDAAAGDRPRGEPPLVRGAAPSSRGRAAWRACRWARRRTTSSPSEEGATIVRIGTSLYG